MIKMYLKGGEIKVIPAKVDEMLEKGWTLEPSKTKPKKEADSSK